MDGETTRHSTKNFPWRALSRAKEGTSIGKLEETLASEQEVETEEGEQDDDEGAQEVEEEEEDEEEEGGREEGEEEAEEEAVERGAALEGVGDVVAMLVETDAPPRLAGLPHI